MSTTYCGKLRKTLVSTACLLLIAQANLASATGLVQAYQAALMNDPQHKAAIADQVAGKEYEVLGRSSLLPSVQYSYSTSKNKGETIGPKGFFGIVGVTNQDYRGSVRNVSVRQTLYNLDTYTRFEQGVLQTQLSDTQFDGRSQDLILRVVSAYVEAKFAEDQRRLYLAQRDSYTEQRRMNDRMYEKGEGTKTDMFETQAKLDVSEALVLESNDAVQNARNFLAGIIGQDITQLDSLREDFAVGGLTILPFDDWKQAAEKSNAEIAIAQYKLEIAAKEITKSRAGHMPRLDLNASYNRGVSESVATSAQDNNMRSIGVQLVIPIYSGGSVNSASKQAVAHHERARAELESAKSKVMIELRKQFNLFNSSATKIEALQKSVNSATLLVEATKQSIKGGMRINADLLNSQQQLVAVKKDLAQARYAYLLSYLKLKATAGIINLTDLQTVAAYFVKE